MGNDFNFLNWHFGCDLYAPVNNTHAFGKKVSDSAQKLGQYEGSGRNERGLA